ncbi:MAG: hypothetical protein AAFR11_15240 [Pseudomonadota bacterium]
MTTKSIIAAFAAIAASTAGSAFAQDHAATGASPFEPMTPQMMRSQIIAEAKATVIEAGLGDLEVEAPDFAPTADEIAFTTARTYRHVAPSLGDERLVLLTSIDRALRVEDAFVAGGPDGR